MGQWIDIPVADGRSGFRGYLATPSKGKGPGAVIVQEVFGVNQHIREVADKYAEEGFVALAPDIFWRVNSAALGEIDAFWAPAVPPPVELGFEAADLAKGRAFVEKMDLDLTIKDIGDAAAVLRARPESTGKVGVVGFCLGGRLAFLAAARNHPDAVAAYYGNIKDNLDEAGAIQCPIVIHFGADDPMSPPAMCEAVRAALANHREAEVYVYPGAGHAFNNWARATHYHPAAAALAHSRTLATLRKGLGTR
ncbi:MAG TPA: dienelactone hydrolase family protein [Candidatus Binataceae bacterium]|nr:dienelactone hydrolase family protein [Candidatus Binataceae bacterium]